jgi:hypothetical protein
MTNANGGPYVQAAVICESVLRDPAGRLSLVNIVEGITIVGSDPNNMPSASLSNWQVSINLWAGGAIGAFSLKLRPWRPNGEIGDAIEIAILDFEDRKGAYGTNTIQALPDYEVAEVGTYWLDVLLGSTGQEDRLLTRIPLIVHHQIQPEA